MSLFDCRHGSQSSYPGRGMSHGYGDMFLSRALVRSETGPWNNGFSWVLRPVYRQTSGVFVGWRLVEVNYLQLCLGALQKCCMSWVLAGTLMPLGEWVPEPLSVGAPYVALCCR